MVRQLLLYLGRHAVDLHARHVLVFADDADVLEVPRGSRGPAVQAHGGGAQLVEYTLHLKGFFGPVLASWSSRSGSLRASCIRLTTWTLPAYLLAHLCYPMDFAGAKSWRSFAASISTVSFRTPAGTDRKGMRCSTFLDVAALDVTQACKSHVWNQKHRRLSLCFTHPVPSFGFRRVERPSFGDSPNLHIRRLVDISYFS